MPIKEYKVLHIYLTKELYNKLDKTAKKRFMTGYKSKFTRLGLKITLQIHEDPQLVTKLNRDANEKYPHLLKYSDRVSLLISDILREHYSLNN